MSLHADVRGNIGYGLSKFIVITSCGINAHQRYLGNDCGVEARPESKFSLKFLMSLSSGFDLCEYGGAIW